MKTILFLLACFAFTAMFWPHTAEAQCSRGACRIQATTPAAEAPIVIQMPATPMRSVCVSGCTVTPLFSPRSGNWWDRGPVRRLASTPWRGGPRARR
jgi:hypothetical protein